MSTDPVAAYLSKAAADMNAALNDKGGYPPALRLMRTHGPRLLAAVETVLAIHKSDDADPAWCAGDAFGWPCKTYRDVAAALLGETELQPPPGMPVHYAPEEHGQAACDYDGPESVMLGTLNPDQVTCEACLALTGNSAAGGESGDGGH